MSDCFYCARDTVPVIVKAVALAHDQRGCVHVCDKHARWRDSTSRMPGHGKDCPTRSDAHARLGTSCVEPLP